MDYLFSIGQAALQKVAAIEGKTYEAVYDSIQELIDLTWKSTDNKTQKKQRELFPGGKPSVEIFVGTMILYLKSSDRLS